MSYLQNYVEMGMSEVFADTSGWISSFISSEPHHVKAASLLTQCQQQNLQIVTTNYVLSELVVLFTRFRVQRSKALTYIRAIRDSTWIEVVHIDEKLDDQAWKLLEARLDKTWSLVDCASFVVMEDRGLTDALTTDRHFEQAGFVRLLS